VSDFPQLYRVDLLILVALCHNGTVTADVRRNPRQKDMPPYRNFLRDESGATAIEYGLIAAGISVAIVAVVNTLGGQVQNTFTTVSTQFGTAGK